MTSRMRSLAASLVLLPTLLLAACGSSSTDTADTTPPTLTIVDDVPGATATGPVTFTFNFSEDVGTSFTAADVTATGGTKGALTKVSATVYAMLITPSAQSGTLSVSVAAGAFSDLAGNANTTAASASQAYALPDVVAPTVAITDDVAAATATGPVTFTFTFSEDVATSFTLSDVTVTGGTKAATLGKTDATHYTLLVTPTAATVGTITVTVPAGSFSDVAGNNNAAAVSATQDYDTVPRAVRVVFADDYAAGVTFFGYNGGPTNVVTVDSTQFHSGTASLRVEVPAAGWTGGTLKVAAPQDLSAYNAVTYWVKADTAGHILNVDGIGDTGVAGPSYKAEVTQVALTTTWTKHIIPIPDPSKMTAALGLFHFAEGSEGAYTIWFDDVQYESLLPADLGAPTGASANLPAVSVAVGGTPFPVDSAPNFVTWGPPVMSNLGRLTNTSFRWYTLTPADPTVASVDPDGVVTGLKAGTTTISVRFGTVGLLGTIPVTVTGGTGPMAPTTTLTPTHLPANVLSMYNSSGTYTDHPGINWAASWGDPNVVTDVVIGGKTVKKYAAVSYVGTEFYANPIDASTYTNFHVDVWTPDATKFGVKLVNMATGGAPQTEGEVQLTGVTTPAISTGAWLSLDIPMSAFAAKGLGGSTNLQQLLFTDNFPTPERGTFFIDNVYFWK